MVSFISLFKKKAKVPSVILKSITYDIRDQFQRHIKGNTLMWDKTFNCHTQQTVLYISNHKSHIQVKQVRRKWVAFHLVLLSVFKCFLPVGNLLPESQRDRRWICELVLSFLLGTTHPFLYHLTRKMQIKQLFSLPHPSVYAPMNVQTLPPFI